jgi:hypothetical protein
LRQKQSTIPIVPSSNLYLSPSYGRFSRDSELRFAIVFRQTWKRIPLAFRRLVVKYWREETNPAVITYGAIQPATNKVIPLIKLSSGWSGFRNDKTDPSEQKGVLAEVFARGFVMRFHAQSVALMADSVLGDLIAHEVAHVFQYAADWRVGAPAQEEPDHALLEEDADGLVRSWGFSDTSIDEWGVQQGLVTFVEAGTDHELANFLFRPGSRYYP